MKKPTILSSEYLFKDEWIRLRKESFRTSSGKLVSPYYVYDFPEWVASLPVDEDGKIILIKQYRHALGDVCIELPGGCVDAKDVDLQHAIARELKEETGYEFAEHIPLGKISANASTNSNWLHMFLSRGGVHAGNPTPDENEEIEVMRVTLAELKELLRDHQFPQSMHVTCILYALEKMNELHY